MAQRFSPFARSSSSGDEGHYNQPDVSVESAAYGPISHGSIPNARSQLDQDIADLIDELDYPNQYVDEQYVDETTTLYQTEAVPSGPSLSIILLCAASAVAGFIIALYVSYRELALSIQASAAIATFFSSVVLGLTGAALSAITNSRAVTSNIAFSCGLIVLSLLFFGLCLLAGAVAALLLLMIAG